MGREETTTIKRLAWLDRDKTYLLLTLALTIFAVAPLSYPGYLQVHSGFLPAYNLADLAGTSNILAWTPSLATHFDPLHGDGLLPYYLALPLTGIGVTPTAAVKVIFAVSLLLGALGMYLWLRHPLGPVGAMLAGLVYTYLPYHLAVITVRGAWGEALFLGLLPLAMGSAVSQIGKPLSWRTSLLPALAWALLGLSQLGLTLWAFLALTMWTILARRHSRIPWSLLGALVGTLIAALVQLAASGWQTVPSLVRFQDHFLYPAQLFSAFWGYGASQPGWDDGLTLGLGFAAIGLTLLTLVLSLWAPTKGAEVAPVANSSGATSVDSVPEKPDGAGPPQPPAVRAPILVALILTCLLFAFAAILWKFTGLHQLLSYPWQLLGLVGLCLAVVAGTSVKLEPRLSSLPLQTAMIIIILLASYPFLDARFTQHDPGAGPLASWDAHQIMLLDYQMQVEIPPRAAGLTQSTGGRVPVTDYGPPKPGDTLHLIATWQIIRPFERDLKVFVHLLDPSGQMAAQIDPLAGAGVDPDVVAADYFTSSWEPGRLIEDDISIPIPPDAAPGSYRIEFGLYDGDTLERLPLELGGSDQNSVVVEVGGNGE